MNQKIITKLSLLLLGMMFLSIGIVLNTKSQLGVGSITTVPYVFSYISQISLGKSISLLYLIFVMIQIIIVRKLDYKIILQFPFSFLVGYFTDFFDIIITMKPQTIIYQIIILIIATLFTALGVYLMINANLILNPSDGIVQTISKAMNKPFGKMKVIFDISMVILSFIMCIIWIGNIVGIGIGTISNALFMGYCISMFDRILKMKEV